MAEPVPSPSGRRLHVLGGHLSQSLAASSCGALAASTSAPSPPRRPVCLILGAGAGIGQAVARRFAVEEGYHACCVRRGGGKGSISGSDAAERLEAFCASVREQGGLATPHFCDATRPEDVRAVVDKVEQDVGPIHVAVYNVGANVGSRDVSGTSYRVFETAWRMGTLGAFAMAKEAIPRMVQRGHGTLIYTSATAALRGNRGQHAHAAAMAGRRALCQSLNHELSRHGIHVCHVVLDGAVDAPDTLGRLMPEYYQKMRQEMLPKENIILPEAVADAFFMLHKQPRNAWTFEMDLRPWGVTAWFNTDDMQRTPKE